jgi:lipopolysaccharide export LptBFGC system permease protein LptF
MLEYARGPDHGERRSQPPSAEKGVAMHRRIGFVIAACGMAFIAVPLSNVFNRADFLMSLLGLAFVIVGTFFAIESVAKQTSQR